MGKKVKEFKAGDFIFAKVKGYPAWPARIQRLNGKKYFIYFYGTGETANLAHNVIFDYAENKDKFLNKTIKRKDFNDGVKQIEFDFANNISIEEVLGGPVADPADSSAANVTGAEATLDGSGAADTTVNETLNESAGSFTATIEATTADSDDGALVIDEGKKNKKPLPGKASSTPKPAKVPKTPKTKKDDGAPASAADEDREEIVSRSGRKIRPKRYADEQTEDNATLPSPIPKKRRTSGEKEIADKAKPAAPQGEKSKNYVAFTVSELENIKETSADLTNNIDQNINISDSKTSTSQKIIPTFGKKRKTSTIDKTTSQPKSKKFIAPVKDVQPESMKNVEVFDKKSETLTDNILQDSSGKRFGINENTSEEKKPSKLTKILSLPKTDLGHLLFGSLTILNEENSFLQHPIEKQLSNELDDITHEQNKSDVTELLSTKDLESFSSVVSLNKVYKDLDAKSKDNLVSSKVLISNKYKILVGDDFCNMFRNDSKIQSKKGFKAMSLINGDMGVKKFFSDLCKEGNEFLNGICDDMESDKESILIACLPSGQYVGVKLFQSLPTSFKNEESKLNWYRQAASNALTLHGQLEKGHITAQSVSAQLETDLNLTDEEKSNLDKEREIEEKKLRVQFLKTEMKMIELDAKIKSCLSLEKADTELCLKLIDELMEIEIKALMLLKHPTCLETIKRMRAYVGNTPSWELSEDEALSFTKHAHAIRKQADRVYKQLKELFKSPEGLSFWEFFSERVLQFKKCTLKLSADELLEMVNEPKEMSEPSAHTMRTAIDIANEGRVETPTKKKNPPAKKRAATASATPTKEPSAKESSTKETPTKEASTKETSTKDTSTKDTPKETPTKLTSKRQARNKVDKKAEDSSASKTADTEVAADGEKDDAFNNAVENFDKGPDKETEKKPIKKQEKANKSKVTNKKKETANKNKDSELKDSQKGSENKDSEKDSKSSDKVAENKDSEQVVKNKDSQKVAENKDSEEVAESKDSEKVAENKDSEEKHEEKSTKDADSETAKPIEESKMDVDGPKTDEAIVPEVSEQNGEADKDVEESTETEKDSAVEKDDEPKAKRPRECNNKKSEPTTPTKTPTKKKSKS